MKEYIGKMTKPRRAIFDTIDNAERPLSFDEIFELAKKEYVGIGERTVYRNLKQMIANNELVRVILPDGQPHRYDIPEKSEKPYVICRQCDTPFNLPSDAKPLLKGYKSSKQFKLHDFKLTFYGDCKFANCPYQNVNEAKKSG